MSLDPTLLPAAMALVLGETALLYALVRLVDRLAPAHCLRERHDLALAAVCLVPVLMALTLMPAEGEIAVPTSADASVSTAHTVAPMTAAPAPSPASASASVPTPTTAPLAPEVVGRAVLALWLLGTFALLGRLLLDVRALRRLIGESTPLGRTGTLALSADLEVRTHRGIASPMLVGLRQATILVPERWRLSTANAPVLEHEIAHARRGDNWTALLQRLLGAVFWWNLPMHLLAPLIASTREGLCDRDAAVATGTPLALAHALLDAASASRQPLAMVPAGLAAQAHGVSLEERVRRLTATDADTPRAARVTLPVLLPLLALTAYLLAPALGQASSTQEEDDRVRGIDEYTPVTSRARANLSLYEAAAEGDLGRVKALLENGSDPSAAAIGDGTPLMGAIRGGHMPIVRALLAAGADPDVAAPGDGTALIAAARRGNRELVRLLLDAGASTDVRVPGDGAALISAAAHNHIAIMEDLLAAGADPNIAVSGDGAPLIAAALSGHVQAARRLLAAGADANGYVLGDETPLINAAQQGHLEVGKLLVSQGADVSLTVRTRDDGWRSPLSQARDRGHQAFVDWLESLGAAHQPGR